MSALLVDVGYPWLPKALKADTFRKAIFHILFNSLCQLDNGESNNHAELNDRSRSFNTNVIVANCPRFVILRFNDST